jgi:bifunctional DNase/RNase
MDETEMVEMALEGVGQAEGGEHIAVLRERGGKRTLGIGVGACPASWLTAHLERVPTRRPHTYALTLGIIERLGGRLVRATIDANGADSQADPEAFVEIQGRQGVLEVGCALEDAVALASCCGAPILVHPRFLRPVRRRRPGPTPPPDREGAGEGPAQGGPGPGGRPRRPSR